MPIELITGHAGTTHISSEDAGAFNAAMFGKDSYVLSAAPELQFTNANTLSISPCELLLQGRHVRLTGVNLVTIESGSQTGLRNDLVYIEYVKDSSGVESTEIKVVRGETGTTAKDPELPHPSSILDGAETADIPIARVKLDKLTPSVEWLLPIKANSTSQFKRIELKGYDVSDIISYAVINGVTYIYFDILNDNTYGLWFTPAPAGSLPKEARPLAGIRLIVGNILNGTGMNQVGHVYVTADGSIQVMCTGVKDSRAIGLVSFPALAGGI